MKHDLAIREENSPFGLVGLFPGPQRLLIFLRWTSYSCPYCRHVFRRDFWPSNVRLGCGERLCRECGKVFDDGTREWPELGLGARLRFIFAPLLVGIWGGFTVAGVIVAFGPARDEHSLFIVMFASAVGLIPIVLSSPFSMIAVLRSKRRCEGAPTISAEGETSAIKQ
jgi:hypothetical protein